MRHLSIRTSFLIFILMWLSFSAGAQTRPQNETTIDLPSNPEFIEPDYERGQAYISLPDSNALLVVSLETLLEVETIEFTGQPTGLDISDDGNVLYVGLNGKGAVAVVELDNQFEYSEINIFETDSEDLVIGDLLEVGGERLFVATREDSESKLRQIDLLDPDQAVTKVGLNTNTNRIESINSKARLRANSGQSILFVQEPNGFFKLDLTQPLLPIISDGYVDPSGFPRAQYTNVGKDFDISIDGELIVTDFGQVIRTSDLKPIAELDAIKGGQSFHSALSLDGEEIFLVDSDTVRVIDTNGRYVVADFNAPCAAAFNTNRTIDIDYVIEADDKTGWYLALSVFSGIRDTYFKLCYIEKTAAFYEGFPAAGQLFDPRTHFPLNGGMKLPYSEDGSENISFISTVANANTQIRGRAARLISNSLGTAEFYSSTINGVFLHRGGDVSTGTLDYIPPIPVTTGAGAVLSEVNYEGKLKSSFGDLELEVFVRQADFEVLELPSGEKIESFKFLQSQVFRENSNFVARVTNHIWLAEDIGFVKVATNIGSFNPENRGFAELISFTDDDADNIADLIDNCPNPNTNQFDLDSDGLGDVCDPDDDGDGMPDIYEVVNGLNPRNSSDRNGDLDGDGFTNIEEFEFGSDPQVFDLDENENGIPDLVDRRARTVVPILELLLGD